MDFKELMTNGRPQFTRVMEIKDDPSHMYASIRDAIKKKTTDEIRMSWEDTLAFVKLSLNVHDEDEVSDIPSDIVFANTIPLKDFSFVMTGDKNTMYTEVEFTFNTFDEYGVIKVNTSDPNSAGVGLARPEHLNAVVVDDNSAFDMTMVNYAAMTMKIKFRNEPANKDSTMVLMMTCDPTYLRLPNGVYSWRSATTNILDKISNGPMINVDDEMVDELTALLYMGISIWYSVNTALLNPVIKDVFVTHSKSTPVSNGKASGKNKRAKIRYVKQHIISMDDVNNAFEKRGFIRRSMIWYVTGHWREYKNGKRIFIQGYWKGALRNMKDEAFQNLEPREREIVTKEENHDET
jgi:hypothetical protein